MAALLFTVFGLYLSLALCALVTTWRLGYYRDHVLFKFRGKFGNNYIAVMLLCVFLWPCLSLAQLVFSRSIPFLLCCVWSQFFAAMASAFAFYTTTWITYKMALLEKVQGNLKAWRRASRARLSDTDNNQAGRDRSSGVQYRAITRAMPRYSQMAELFVKTLDKNKLRLTLAVWIVSFFGLPWLYPKTWFITTTEAFANTDLCGPSHAAFICLGFWFFWLLPYLYVFSKFQIFDPFRIQFKLQIQVLSILVLGSVYIVNISLTKQLLANRDLKLFEIGLLLLFFTTLWVMESVVPLYMLHRGSKDPLQGEALLQPPLAEILAFNPTLEMFEDFLLSEWSPENLAFYKEVVKYESTAQKVADWVEKKGEKAVDYLCKKAIRIYETYVAINSEQQVNLSDRVAEPLHKFFRRPHMLKLAKDAHIAATGPSKGNLEMVTPISRVASQFSLNSASRSPISTTRKKINEKKTSGVHTLEEKASNAKTRIQRQHSLDKCDKQDANKTKVNHFGLSRSPVRHPDRTMQRSHSFTMAVAQLSNTKFSSVKRGSAEVITAMYVFIDAKEEAFQLMQKDSYMRFLALPQTQSILRQSCISSRRPQNVQKRSLKNSFSLSRSQSKVDIGNPRHEIFSATETDTRTSGSNIICATTRDSKSTLRDSNTRVKRESKAGNTSNTKLPRTSSSHVDGFRDINMSVVTVGTAAHESLQSSYVRRSSALEMLPFFALHGKQNPSLIVSKLTSPTAQHSEKSFGRQSQSQFRSSSISISHLSHSNPNPSNPTCLRVSPSSQRQKKVPIATPVSEAKKFLSSGGKTHDRHNHRQCY